MDPRDNLVLDLFRSCGKHNIPIIGGFVRDIVIPRFYEDRFENSKLKKYQRCQRSKPYLRSYKDIDILVKSKEEVDSILSDLKDYRLDWMERVESQGVYPWPKVVALFNFEYEYIQYKGTINQEVINLKTELMIDFLICEQYIPTDFYENNIYYFPPSEMKIFDDLIYGELIAPDEIVDNLLNSIVTIKPEYVRKIVQYREKMEKHYKYIQESKKAREMFTRWHRLTYRFTGCGFYAFADIKFHENESGKYKDIILGLSNVRKFK